MPSFSSDFSNDTHLPPQGFVFHERVFHSPRHQVVRMLIPCELKDELDDEAARVRVAASLEEQRRSDTSWALPAAAPAKPPPAEWWQSDPVLQGATRLNGVLRIPEPLARSDQLRVYSLEEVANRLDALQPAGIGGRGGSSGNKERDRDIFQKLKAKGPLRKVASSTGWGRRLDRLEVVQPHFAPVLQFLRGRFAQAAASGKPVFFPPMLLVGEAGVGKTHFALELAKALGVTARRHGMDSADTSAALTGSHKSWSGSTLGLVFEEVCLSEHANPVIVLDELDKASSNRYGNPLGPLHTLLETVSSCWVRDISLDFEFDASHVTWIATANELDRIPVPLQSRFEVFDIEMPTPEQARVLARHVAKTVVAAARVGMRRPGEAIVAAITAFTPREMKKVLNAGIGRALLDGRRVLRLGDLDLAEKGAAHKAAMGFGTRHGGAASQASKGI